MPLDYVLNLDDWLNRRTFEDEICRNAYPIDLHTTAREARCKTEIDVMKRFPQHAPGESHGSNDSSNMMLEVRTAFLLARVKMGLLPPEDPEKYMNFPQSHPKRAAEWMTAREALELGTLGGARVLGRDDIGSLETGKCADFFSINLNTVDFAGALHDPVAATVFCAPQKAQHTVINGRVIVQDGKCVTVDLGKIVEEHNKFSIKLAKGCFSR